MTRFGGIAVYVEAIPQSLPHAYRVYLQQGHSTISGRGLNFTSGRDRLFTSKRAAVAFGKTLCRKIEHKHNYEPNSHWNVSLGIEGLGKQYDGMFRCVNQRFVEYRKMR